MPRNLEELWDRIRDTSWPGDLPPWLPSWLREGPAFFLIAGGLLFLLIYFLLWFFVLRRRDSVSRQLLAEIRQLRREGDFLGVGERYETLGQIRKALVAYHRGGLYTEHAELLLRHGRRDEAKRAAREGEVWVIYADLCRDDKDFEEAAVAYERAGKLYDSARSWESAGRVLKAAHAYAAVGMEYNAVQLLMKEEGGPAAEALEGAIRSSLKEAKGASMSPDMVRAVQRCAQIWLAEGDPERAYGLAVDSEQWEVAVPIARDYLEADSTMIDVCLKAGAHLAAAEIAAHLGDTRGEALYRAEHFQRHDRPAESAHWFEKAEEWSQAADRWAAADDMERAAELYARAEEFEQAAQIYASLGNEARKQAMRDAARAHDPRQALEADDETRRVRPQPPAGTAPAATTPVATTPAATTPAGTVPSGESAAAIPMPPFFPLPVSSSAESDSSDDAGGRYVLEEEVGRGGMGVVYRAHDQVLDRKVAYKVLSPDVTGVVGDSTELLKEARAAARLSHPNIVQVYDAGRVASGFFVVMELVEGENFGDLLKERKMAIAGAIGVGRQICAALDHAHKRQIVHRDLKPSNLMWTAEGQIKLTDFGLARFFESSLGKVQTQPAGTPYYMAPEQIRGDPVDVRTDLYSFGCVLFEMLCNHTPFTGGGSSIYHHLNSRPQDPRVTRREIPQGLAAIILACLEKDPDKRPASAAIVGQQLAALTASGTQA